MKISLKKCACEGSQYHRIPRAFWMRLFPSRRLYKCSECTSSILARQVEMEALIWQITSEKFLTPSAAEKKPSP